MKDMSKKRGSSRKPCAQCGKSFPYYNSAKRKHCSVGCKNAARRKPKTCEGCGVLFFSWGKCSSKSGGRRFCGRKCFNDVRRKAPRDGRIQCSRCLEVKIISAFYRDNRRRTGVTLQCRQCIDSTQRGTRLGYKERHLTNPIPAPETKKCSRCREVKLGSSFSISRHTKDGLCITCKPCQALSRRANQAKISARRRAYTITKKYGLTHDEYRNLLSIQNGVCAICSEPERATYRGAVTPLRIDHDHITGMVRGLLCSTCNTGIGHLRDSLELLKRATRYLEDPPTLKINLRSVAGV